MAGVLNSKLAKADIQRKSDEKVAEEMAALQSENSALRELLGEYLTRLANLEIELKITQKSLRDLEMLLGSTRD